MAALVQNSSALPGPSPTEAAPGPSSTPRTHGALEQKQKDLLREQKGPGASRSKVGHFVPFVAGFRHFEQRLEDLECLLNKYLQWDSFFCGGRRQSPYQACHPIPVDSQD